MLCTRALERRGCRGGEHFIPWVLCTRALERRGCRGGEHFIGSPFNLVGNKSSTFILKVSWPMWSSDFNKPVHVVPYNVIRNKYTFFAGTSLIPTVSTERYLLEICGRAYRTILLLPRPQKIPRTWFVVKNWYSHDSNTYVFCAPSAFTSHRITISFHSFF